jgi:beta-glucosidase-like glycosyl hydrolase
VVGDYVLEMYESRLNYVSEKEMYLKDEEIKRMKEENKKKDEEIKRIKEEKEKKGLLQNQKPKSLSPFPQQTTTTPHEQKPKSLSPSSSFPQQTTTSPHEQKPKSLSPSSSFPKQTASINNLKKETMNKRGFFFFFISF